MRPIRCVVFDLFDTLVDLPMESLPRVEVLGRTIPSTYRALHDALAERHPGIGFEAFARALAEVDRGWREVEWPAGRELPTLERFARLAAALGVESDPQLPARLTDVHMGLLASLVRVHPHHVGLAARLRARARLGVCSNFSHTPTALAVLDGAGLRDCFDAVVVSHDVGLRKPRREIFEAVLAALGADPAETLHVGDDLAADVEGAAALGIRTAWLTRCVRDPAAARGRTPAARPDFVVHDLAELPALLDAAGP